MCSILRTELSKRVGAACCFLGFGVETVSAAPESLLLRLAAFVGYTLIGFSAIYRLPQHAFSFSELCLWRGMYRLHFSVSFCGIRCLKVWKVGPFFHPVRGPFILQAPWREGYGGCRSQGCHGYSSRSARSDSWPHLPYFRHHSPSLSIVMSLNVAKCNLG